MQLGFPSPSFFFQYPGRLILNTLIDQIFVADVEYSCSPWASTFSTWSNLASTLMPLSRLDIKVFFAKSCCHSLEQLGESYGASDRGRNSGDADGPSDWMQSWTVGQALIALRWLSNSDYQTIWPRFTILSRCFTGAPGWPGVLCWDVYSSDIPRWILRQFMMTNMLAFMLVRSCRT